MGEMLIKSVSFILTLHMVNNKGVSFGTTVAVLGSTLIAVGIAWLIAQNWHQLSAALKIIILLGATALAYTGGVMLRLRSYHGVGKAVIVLGGLLYTLSVFLIAQIYSTATSLQGTAFLLLLSWAGVLIASYIFDTPASLVVALVEFMIWLGFQYNAFFEGAFEMFPAVGLATLLSLFIGAIFYGLSLWHRARNHEFAQLYQLWTAFYLLVFTYMLSFQIVLPMLWPEDAVYPTSALVFVFVAALLSLITVISGIATSSGRVAKKEVVWFSVAVVLLLALIGSASFVSRTTGTCTPRNCGDYRARDACVNTPSALRCQWREELAFGGRGFCSQEDCYSYLNETSCVAEQCAWSDGRCGYPSCWLYRDQTSCESAQTPLGCTWGTPQTPLRFGEISIDQMCVEKQVCQGLTTRDACTDNSLCRWGPFMAFGGFLGAEQKTPSSLWAMWIFANIVFLVIILGIIGYGTWQHLPKLVNLGIAFFALDIITRYIGFIMDFRGYVSLSIIFITGGVILLAGGYFVERWRRNLVRRAKGKST